MEKITLSLPIELLARRKALPQEQCHSAKGLMGDALQDDIARQQQTIPDRLGMIDTEGDFSSTNVRE